MTKLLALLAALSATAYADATYKRTQTLRIDVKQTDRTKPIAPTSTPAKPIITANDVMKVELGAQRFRVEQEGILEKLIAETPDDDPDKPELLFRLAEQYAKQLRFWRLQSVDTALKASRL